MNWNLYQRKAIRAVCLVSRICFVSLVTIQMTVTFLIDWTCGWWRSLCDHSGHVARKLTQLIEVSTRTVHSVSFRQSTSYILEPLSYSRKILIPGTHFYRFSFNGHGCSIMISRSQGDTQQGSIWLAALAASYQINVLSVFINKPAKAASCGDLHYISVTLYFGSRFLLSVPWKRKWEWVKLVIWTSVYPLWHALLHFVLTASLWLVLWVLITLLLCRWGS